jgi:hypothetical protein
LVVFFEHILEEALEYSINEGSARVSVPRRAFLKEAFARPERGRRYFTQSVEICTDA